MTRYAVNSRPLRRLGMTLLEIVIASTLLTGIVAGVSLVMRTGYTSWSARDGDLKKIEAAQATIRHVVRSVRQAKGIISISGTALSLAMPAGQTRAWSYNAAASTVYFGIPTATNILAEGISGFTLTGYRADGTTVTSSPAQIQLIKVQVQVSLPRDVGGSRTISCLAWVRSF